MNRRDALVAALLVVGVAGVASPLVLFEFHEERHAVTFERVPEEPASLEDSDVVAYADLPAETRRNLPHVGAPTPIGDGDTVEASYGGFTAAEWDRADALRDHEYVRLPTDVAGENGSVATVHDATYGSTPRYLGATADAFYAMVAGALAFALGVLRYRSERLFPFRPGSAAALAVAGASAVGAYRVVVADSLGNSPYNHAIALAFANGPGSAALVLGAAFGFVLGSTIAWGERRRTAGCLLAGIATLAAFPVLGYGAPGPVAVFGAMGGTLGVVLGTLPSA